MMSLEATRYLWSARLDPRRRTYAVGTYAHVLDQWGILYVVAARHSGLVVPTCQKCRSGKLLISMYCAKERDLRRECSE
jgi:hypothetical protein